MGRVNRTAIVKETVRRFHHLPDKTIARHLIANYGDLFDNNLEKARSAVRYYTGKNGKTSRHEAIAAHTDGLFKDFGLSQLPKTWRPERPRYKLKPGTWLVISDVHIPFHEPKPFEAAIQWGQSQHVDGLFINGDFQDCHAVTFWPTVIRDFDHELEISMDFLDILCHEFKGKQIVYKPGNHELRLPRRFADKIPELATSPLAAMETYMGFEERGIEFLDYYQLVMAGKLPIIHGHEVPAIDRTVNPARGLYLRTKSWSLCSHCHRTSEHTSRDIHEDLLTTWSIGCLCNLSPDWNPYGNDWNWGCAIIYVAANGDFEVENKRILPSGKLR